jgi:hypothetical protein
MIAALVSVMRLPTRRFSRVCRQKLLQPCMAMRAQCSSCLQCPMQLLALYHTLLSPRATRDLRAMQNYETSITL